MSFRGTTDDFSRTKSFFSDWKTNSKIALNPKSAENTKRFKQAFTDTEKTIRLLCRRYLLLRRKRHREWKKRCYKSVP